MSRFALLVASIVVLAGPVPATPPGEAPRLVPGGDAPPGFDREVAAADCLSHLQDLIRINTSNSQAHDPADPRPNGNELASARWFADRLAGIEGVETHVLEVEEHPGRANFVAILRAVEPSRAPVLVMGHMDVVGADAAHWGTAPFEPTIVDGYLYGRGAIDCKGPLAAELTAFVALAQVRDQLVRDVVFFATAAEEGGPGIGVGRVLERHADLLGEPEFALNEGGRVRVEGDVVVSINVQTTEKVAYNVIATATGPSGHGSVPLPENALAALARACARVHDWRAPAHLNETTAEFFRRSARVERDPLLRSAMAVLGGEDEGPELFDRAVDMLSTVPAYNAVLRAGASLTLLDGGFRTNVIPSTGQATFNVRILPDDDIEEIVAAMEAAGGEPSVTFALQGEPRIAPPTSPLDTALFEAMESAGRAMAPDAEVIPFLSTGGTDGAALRAVGIPTYGILPIPLRMEDELRMHGDDERAPVSGLGWAAEYVYRVLLAVAT